MGARSRGWDIGEVPTDDIAYSLTGDERFFPAAGDGWRLRGLRSRR
jgi:hypothetical protein